MADTLTHDGVTVTLDGTAYTGERVLRYDPVPIAQLQATQPYSFSLADPDAAFLPGILNGSLRGRSGSVVVASWRYDGTVDSARWVDGTVHVTLGNRLSGVDSVRARRTSSEDQKALASTDTSFDAMQGEQSFAAIAVNWVSQ